MVSFANTIDPRGTEAAPAGMLVVVRPAALKSALVAGTLPLMESPVAATVIGMSACAWPVTVAVIGTEPPSAAETLFSDTVGTVSSLLSRSVATSGPPVTAVAIA